MPYIPYSNLRQKYTILPLAESAFASSPVDPPPHSSLTDFDREIVSLIDYLQLLDDKQRGVVSTYKAGSDSHGNPVSVNTRIRNPEATINPTWHQAAIIGLNEIHAANKLLKMMSKEHALKLQENGLTQATIENMVNTLLRELQTTTNEESALVVLKGFNTNILKPFYDNIYDICYKEPSTSDPKKEQKKKDEFFEQMSMLLQNLSGLDHPQRIIETEITIPVSVGKPPTFVLRDEPLIEVTDQIQSLYCVNSNDEDIKKQDWFSAVPDDAKPFVYDAAVKIKKHIETHGTFPTLGTQFRSWLPGLRNAYHDTLSLESEKLYSGYHFGNPGHLIGKDSSLNTDLTAMTMRQFHASGKHEVEFTGVNTLVSASNPTNPNDKKLLARCHEQSETAIAFSNTPVNAGRFAPDSSPWLPSGLDLDGVEKLSSFTRKFIAERLKDNSEIGANKHFANVQILMEQLDSRRKDTSGTLFVESDYNKNMGLATLCKRIASEIALFYQDFNSIKKDILFGTGCASGKDRDGVTRVFTYAETIYLLMYPNKDRVIDYTSDNFIHILTAVAESGHLQRMASGKGSTIGCYGLKDDSESAIPSNLRKHISHLLLLETSKFNKSPPIFGKAQISLEDIKDYSYLRFLSEFDNLPQAEISKELQDLVSLTIIYNYLVDLKDPIVPDQFFELLENRLSTDLYSKLQIKIPVILTEQREASPESSEPIDLKLAVILALDRSAEEIKTSLKQRSEKKPQAVRHSQASDRSPTRQRSARGDPLAKPILDDTASPIPKRSDKSTQRERSSYARDKELRDQLLKLQQEAQDEARKRSREETSDNAPSSPQLGGAKPDE